MNFSRMYTVNGALKRKLPSLYQLLYKRSVEFKIIVLNVEILKSVA